MIKIFIFMVIAILTGIWLSNYIMTKIQVSLNLPIMIPIKHKMLLSRNIIKIENPTLFKVREKRGFSILKIMVAKGPKTAAVKVGGIHILGFLIILGMWSILVPIPTAKLPPRPLSR